MSSKTGDELWGDNLATNLACESEFFSCALGNDSVAALPAESTEAGITVVLKRVRNTNWDRPLQNWYQRVDEYLEENLRHEGYGVLNTYMCCAGSHCVDATHQCPARECEGIPEWRCVDQECLRELMFCTWCILATHSHHPTHFVEKWNGSNFARKRTWLQELGLRVQLGHPPAKAHDFVLCDLSGVHELSVDFCGCQIGNLPPTDRRIQLLRARWWPAMITSPNTCATFRMLRLFQTLNCLGKLTAYDFLRWLEKCTNHDGLDKPPDRTAASLLCTLFDNGARSSNRRERSWVICGRRERNATGGIGARLSSMSSTRLELGRGMGECASSLKLSKHSVSSEAADPIMGDGCMKRYGEDGYNSHIAKHVDEAEILNCSGFKAMFQANAKRTKGLRTMGVGGITCSRHNMWRVNDIGDLEYRQCNMDFILLVTLIAFELLWLIISYDITCQYAINFWTRMSAVQERMWLKLVPSNTTTSGVIPRSLSIECRAPGTPMVKILSKTGHSLSGPQAQRDSWGQDCVRRRWRTFSDFTTTIDCWLCPKRLAVAMMGAVRHKAMLDAFTNGLEEENPEQVKRWRALVDEWESKQHKAGEITLEIAKEELMRTENGDEVEHEHTPSWYSPYFSKI
ncbi:hypothetical protein K438DRAFT_1784206 [Mycena galopus ATCC 62051]|nr:hypothetical protein K438DRAFT_1784206 [Mycena galopus ATCC 62051]